MKLWFLAIPAAFFAVAFFPRKTASGATTSALTLKKIFGPFQIFGPFMPSTPQNKYDDIFKRYGNAYGIEPEILKAIAIQESSLNPNAAAKTSTARGLMQMTKAACTEVGESYEGQFEPETAIRSGAKYLKHLMVDYRFTVQDAIRAYYAGAGTILDGDKGKPFKQSWQPAAYNFANNTYLPKIQNRANSLDIA